MKGCAMAKGKTKNAKQRQAVLLAKENFPE